MKVLVFLFAITVGFSSAADVPVCQSQSAVVVAEGVFLDLGKGHINVNGTSYRYLLGSEQVRAQHMNRAGRVNIVDIEGYVMTVNGVAQVFVITKLDVVALQG